MGTHMTCLTMISHRCSLASCKQRKDMINFVDSLRYYISMNFGCACLGISRSNAVDLSHRKDRVKADEDSVDHGGQG